MEKIQKIIVAKKSLGQNFLKCGWALQAIIGASDIHHMDTVVEIGPGKGVLTGSLLSKSNRVIVVEKDDRLIPFLTEKFQQEISNKKITIIHGDILENETSKKLFTHITATGQSGRYKLIANIPYYITGQLLENFLSAEIQPEKMVLMLQKEVVKRIVTTDKKESILSISVKAFGTPKKIIDVPRSCFSPAPNVDSAILEIKDISKKTFESISEKHFFEVVKTGFAHKRKVLAGNLKDKYEKTAVEAIFAKLNLSPKVRAEELEIGTWVQLSQNLRTI